MAARESTLSSQSEGSSTLDLPSAHDIRDYVLQKPCQEASSEALSSLATFSFPCSSDVDPDSSNLSTEQNDSWTCENFWLDPSVKSQPETQEESDDLRKSLDRFYDTFGHSQPSSRNTLSASVSQCLSQKIAELKGQDSQTYALRSFQMAQVIFNRDGCSVLEKHSKDISFCPAEEGSMSLDDEKPIPGLSKDVIRYLLQQNVMKDP